jgi:hypothetical protein
MQGNRLSDVPFAAWRAAVVLDGFAIAIIVLAILIGSLNICLMRTSLLYASRIFVIASRL